MPPFIKSIFCLLFFCALAVPAPVEAALVRLLKPAQLSQLKDAYKIIDARPVSEWEKGHIPEAVRINWTNFFTGNDRSPISKEQLVELLRKHDIDPEKPVVYYCSGGVRSAYAWTVHELAGLKRAKNYEGGMETWQRVDSR